MRTFRTAIIAIAVLCVAFTPLSVHAQQDQIPVSQRQFQLEATNPQAQTSAQPAQSQGFNLFPIVTCGTQAAGEAGACTPCGLLDIAENTVKFVAIGLTGPIAALMFIYAGFLFLFYGANPSMASRAKTVMTNAVYGVAIVLMSWIITVQLIKTVAPTSNAADHWYEFNCPQFLGGIGIAENLQNPEPGIHEAVTELPGQLMCKEEDWGDLAEIFGTDPDPEAVSPELQDLIDCLLQDPVVRAAYDPSQLFTFENNRPVCNIIRGYNNCGRCQHALYSCHYGGGSGSEGAQAVDFNFKGQFTGEVTEVTDPDTGRIIVVRNEEDLAHALIRAAAKYQCNYKLLNFEGTHTHISTLSCDSDGTTTSIKGITP